MSGIQIFSNSKLVSYTKISPNKTSPRNHVIDTITIHCVVGQCSVETLGDIFAPTSRRASSNYGIGYDGRIGMYVEEKDRSWCSSSSSNDNRAITIEVASDTTDPYAVNDKAMSALIELVADICRRNNIKELKWKGDKSLIGQVDKQNMTVHRWFAAKSCPGDYLYNKHSYIAKEVNKKLGVVSSSASSEKINSSASVSSSNDSSTILSSINTLTQKGIIDSSSYWKANYKNLKSLDTLLMKLANATQSTVSSSFSNAEKAIEHLVKCNVINSPDYWIANYKKVTNLDKLFISAANHIPYNEVPYLVKITADALNIRKEPTVNSNVTSVIKNKGIYTIVAEKDGAGATKWLKLKSGIGWISSDYTRRV